MLIVFVFCICLIALATVIHYEVLRMLNFGLPSLKIPNRTKLLVVIFGALAAHAMEMSVFGVTFFCLVKYMGVGSLRGTAGISFINCLYFSAETYTSLGFGDLTPTGPVRMLAGVEALTGLLLIGWSASYTYLAMKRFWKIVPDSRRKGMP
jgi:hypothetical protein